MKSEFNDIEKCDIKYPCLKKYNNTDNTGSFVVLFTDNQSGTVVFTEDSSHTVGEYATNWATQLFIPIKGEIILKN